MAISSAVMDSVCDNGCNTLSVLFTLGLTCLLCSSPVTTAHCRHISLTRAPPTHTHSVKQKQTIRLTEGRGPHDGASRAEACMYASPHSLPPLSCTRTTSTSEHNLGGGKRRKQDLIMLRPHQSAKWKACFLGVGEGWG